MMRELELEGRFPMWSVRLLSTGQSGRYTDAPSILGVMRAKVRTNDSDLRSIPWQACVHEN